MADYEIPSLKSRIEEEMVYLPGARNPNGHIYINVRAFSLSNGNKVERLKCSICKKEQSYICFTCTMKKPQKKLACHPPGTECSKQHEK